ncbi:MAG: hypothetical protein MUE84_05695 [Hyphomonas sp.]|nr:hypothetical protein [Hyphomonas sp.]
MLDANTIRKFIESHHREQLLKRLGAAEVEVWPNAIGVLELLQIANSKLRLKLLRALAELSGNRSVRPLPTEVLRLTGQMLLAKAPGFDWPNSGLEFLLYEPDQIRDEHVAMARTLLSKEREQFEDLHKRARSSLRPLLDEKALRAGTITAREFLDTFWIQPPIVEPFVDMQWRALGLPGSPDARSIIRNDAWRLTLEGFGVSIYERALMNKTPRPVHSADLRQLVYMAGNHRAILITDDQPLQRVASGVFSKRHPDLRVMSSADILGHAT